MRTALLAASLCLVPLAAFAQQIQPGQWSYSSKITHVEGEHVTPQMQQALMGGPADTDTKCIGAQEAATGLQAMLKEKNHDCTLTSNSFAGGVLDATRTCKDGGGMTVFHLHGPVTPTAFTLNATGDAPHGMKIGMTVTAKRIGACK